MTHSALIADILAKSQELFNAKTGVHSTHKTAGSGQHDPLVLIDALINSFCEGVALFWCPKAIPVSLDKKMMVSEITNTL